MFQARRSVKSSSSENEGEEIQTPTKKSVRVPLQEVLTQCSAQRDLINSISKRRSVAVPGTNLTPLIRRMHLQDDGLQVSSLVYEDLCQKIFVEEDCVNVPQARGLTPLVTHTAPKANALRGTRSLSAASGLHSTIPECLPTEGADSAPASVHGGALTCPALKGEPVAIEAQEDAKLLIGDTTITSGLVGHRSSTPVKSAAGQTLTGPVPKAGTGSTPPANLEMAGWPDAFQCSYPRVMADTSCGIVPEMEVDEGLAEVSLKHLALVDGLSTLSGIEPMGASTGHLPRVEVGQVEGGAEEVGQVEGGAEEVGQVEGGAEEVGQVEGGAEEVGQVEGGAEEVGQVEGGAEEVGQVEGGAEEVGQVEGGAEEMGQVEGGAEEVGQVDACQTKTDVEIGEMEQDR
ncbi:uncharacterized protein [Heterodontus francisci]|uniref:uncharacterized protein n=1 Tax=Heterodontus francisci TaxID=7792 RepID=UPI00355B11FF